MIFYISTEQRKDLEFLPHQKNYQNYWLYFDQGWNVNCNIIYKKSEHSFTSIKLVDNNIIVETENPRLTPIYTTDKSISNFQTSNTESFLSCDHQTCFVDYCLEKNYKKSYDFSFDTKKLDQNRFVDFIIEHLIDYISNINKEHVYVCDSQGYDSTLIIAVCRYLNKNFSTVRLGNNKSKTLFRIYPNILNSSVYGPTHIPLVNDPSASYITGLYGDEYMLRSPFYTQGLFPEINFTEIFDKNKDCYMWKFFDENYRHKMSTAKSLTKQTVIDMIMNDYQHYHIDHHVVYCPYHSTDLLQASINVEKQVAVDQQLDAKTSRLAIQKLDKSLLDHVSNVKNQFDPDWL